MSYRLPATVSLLMAVLLPSLVGGCGHQTEASPAPPIPVTVRDLRPNNAPENVRYSANIQPNTQVSLAFQVTGYVDQITQVPGANGKRRSIQSGDFVRKGTLLATIHSDLYQRQLDNAEAQVEGAIAQQVQSKADLDRFTKLLKQAIISQAQYDASLKASQAADSQLKSARAALEQAKINLGYCKLYAPMDGLILSRDIEPGTLAGPGVTAFEIADTDEVKAVFGVSDSVVKDLRMGEPLSIKTRAYPNESFPGTISRIAPNADPTTRVFDIEVTIANADGRLRTGMVASLRLDDALAKVDKVPTVPLNSIVKLPGEPDRFAIYVVDGHSGQPRARLRNVELGDIIGNEVAVTAGAEQGDQVIVRGAGIVNEGSPVTVIPH